MAYAQFGSNAAPMSASRLLIRSNRRSFVALFPIAPKAIQVPIGDVRSPSEFHRNKIFVSFAKPKQQSRFFHASVPRLKKNFYDFLGVGRNASTDEIKKKYRELVKKNIRDLNKVPLALFNHNINHAFRNIYC